MTAFRVLRSGPGAVGYMTAALGVGGLVGAVGAFTLSSRRLAVPFGVALVFWGLPIALVAPKPYLVVALGLLAVVGAANSIEDVAGLTLLQRVVPDEVLTRVLGVLWGLAMGGVALGSIVAHRNNAAGLPLWQPMAWGMLYGAIFSLGIALALGKPLDFEVAPRYVLSLLYLAFLGSVLAFASYLTLLERIGPARSGYIGVMVPIVALVISAFVEHFRWQPLTFVGIAISVLGNVIILRGK